jgi:nucleolin
VPAKRARAGSNVSKESKNSGTKARKTSEDKRVPAKKSKKDSSSSDSDSSSDAKPAAKKAAKKDSSSDSDSDSDKKDTKKKSDSSSGDDSDSSSSSGSAEKASNGATAADTKVEEKKTSEAAPVDKNDPNFGKVELFVQGCSFDSDENSLRTHFEAHGTLTKVKVLYGKGKAFIEYESHEQAAAALAALNETEIDGRQVWIEFSGNPAGGYKPGASSGEATTIFCGNLSFKSD